MKSLDPSWSRCSKCRLFAQTDRGTITATVSDPANAVVANAQVEAKNVEAGTTFQAGTSGYRQLHAGPGAAGTYEVTASVAGFKNLSGQASL